MKVVILAGGLGTRISEESHLKPKPMITIGEQPILWHIMKYYSSFGFHDFIICCGYKGYCIKEYFADYYLYRSDVTFDFSAENHMTVHNNDSEPWRVTLVDTGLEAQTGTRIKRVEKYIGQETFMLTYGDGVGDININELLNFHRKSSNTVTLTGIQPGGRFGVLDLDESGTIVNGFREKAKEDGGWINAGFMVMEPKIFSYLKDDNNCILEREPLENLAKEGKLGIYKHNGFWQCMDTQRDRAVLEEMWKSGHAPWVRSEPEKIILRAKTIDLRVTRPLNALRKENSIKNEEEAKRQDVILTALPRRLVFELTSACNLNCKMCGRNAANFRPTIFQMKWLKYFEPVVDRIEEVTLMGWGEPTVHPQFADFLSWAYKFGLRKYFCTNGMRLDKLFDDIFRTETDIIAVSMDGACAKTNEEIRRGADFEHIIKTLSKIVQYKTVNKLKFPYLNFVFAAMDENLKELPDLVRLASNIGLDEVKVVYLTAFDEIMKTQVLYDKMNYTREVFEHALEVGKSCGVALKLPHLVGEDPAGDQMHKTCYTGWRDFFLGSDGFVRPCMSTAQKLFSVEDYPDFWSMWNSPEYQKHRSAVNSSDMVISCRNCYQSSFANWNKIDSFIQVGQRFSPEW